MLDPCYDSYEPAVELAGGHCIHVPLQLPDFAVDWQRLADAITPRTRLIFINSPHNPSGALLSRADLDQLADMLSTLVEGGIVMSKALREPRILAKQVMLYRAFVQSVFLGEGRTA